MVICPACGGTSHDREFCDHCNADLMPPAVRDAPPVCNLGPEGTLLLSPDQSASLARPEASVTLRTGPRGWRLHWLPQPAWPHHRATVEDRVRRRVPPLPPCRVVPEAQGAWVVAEAAAPQALPWAAPPARDALQELRHLDVFLGILADALEELHAAGLVWLTFDPKEIELVPDAGKGWRARFTNLDLGVYQAGRSPEQLVFNPKFAAPEVARFRAADLGSATDVFHLAVFAYCWLARLLPNGFLGAGLEAFGFALPPLRTFAPQLPAGVVPVLARALAIEPARRFPTPAAFRAAFHTAVERAERRAAATTPVRWDVGIHTRAGRAKGTLGRANEDCALQCRYAAPDRILVAVADGISSCDVGTGRLASQLTCQRLETAFGPRATLDQFATGITAVCRQAAQGLLDWALQHGHREALVAGKDLMGTTLTAGWLEGNRLVLANLGDSRAYLVGADGAEQLTVDGDVGSALLAAGVPPEDVREAGTMAKALRDCIGGCGRGPTGEPRIEEQFCIPAILTWRLLPGDFVVLCTDGLVEEGLFLNPPILADLVRRHRDLPAADLAVKLADAADSLQRPPSAAEPEGFGDNISCVVIKVVSG